MRAPVDTIAAPPFPRALEWLNAPADAAERSASGPLLVEFWDFCRVNSLRTLPYVRAWHERYADAGLSVVAVHSPGFEPSRDPAAVRDAVRRLGIEHPVCVDPELEVWALYDNRGWPARYLFDRDRMLLDYHFGEGAYVETELAIQELLGVRREPVEPVRPEDDPQARIAVPTPDQPGAWSGAYEAGEVWAVLDGVGEVRANAVAIVVDHPGCFPLVRHERHTAATLELEVGPGVRCHAVCFTPGVAR
jgi:hypothetical protein